MPSNCALSRPRASRAAAPTVITVPHASGALPYWVGEGAGGQAWPAIAGSHHALDRRALELARAMAPRLGARLVEGEFTRLALDPNRPLDHPEAILRTVEGRVLPFNQNMPRGDLAARRHAHRRFHKAVDAALSEAGPAAYLIDQHSFDRYGPSPVARDVDIGICAPGDTEFALRVLEELRSRTTPRAPAEAPDVRRRRLNVRLDEPYSAAHPGAFVMASHIRSARAGVVIEVCDDLIGTDARTKAMADLLAESIAAAAEAHSAAAGPTNFRRGEEKWPRRGASPQDLRKSCSS